MNKKIKQICQDIRNNKLLEENIPQLFNHTANHYQTIGAVRLAMHYFAFYEAYVDEEDTWSPKAKEVTRQVNTLIHDNILQSCSGPKREKALKRIDEIRKDITKRMDILIAYTDIFQTYEYILNRIEYRFVADPTPMESEEFAKEILRYIFDSEDNLIINEKIKEIIGQLPIRITKQKYFELLKESLHSYLGSDKASLDSYLYMLRTAAMLYREDSMEDYYPALWEKKEYLAKLQYTDISKEDYDKALTMLRAAILILETETTVYFGLQEIVNEGYAILLCAPYTGMADSLFLTSEKAAFAIIGEINALSLSEKKQELLPSLIEKFADLEGVQEEISFELSTLEDSLYTVSKNHFTLLQSMMLDQLHRVLLLSQKLLSGSLFINLEEVTEETIVEEELLEATTKEMVAQLTELFDTHDRIISRAVMANTLNKMPVFFKDHKEVMDYVCYSLERCTDPSERAAVYEIINAIMSE